MIDLLLNAGASINGDDYSKMVSSRSAFLDIWGPWGRALIKWKRSDKIFLVPIPKYGTSGYIHIRASLLDFY